jgi:hypothetical protein
MAGERHGRGTAWQGNGMGKAWYMYISLYAVKFIFFTLYYLEFKQVMLGRV